MNPRQAESRRLLLGRQDLVFFRKDNASTMVLFTCSIILHSIFSVCLLLENIVVVSMHYGQKCEVLFESDEQSGPYIVPKESCTTLTE